MIKNTKIISRQNNIHLVSYHEYIPEHLWGVVGGKEIKTTIVSHYMSGGTLEGEQLQIIYDEK